MRFDLVDLMTLTEFRNCVSSFTKLDFSLYEGSNRLLVPPLTRDPIIEAFSSSGVGRSEQEEFIKSGIQKAILRRSTSIFKGPMNQYHAFIPAQTAGGSVVLVGNAFYSSTKDIDDFYVAKGSTYGISGDIITAWIKRIIPNDLSKVSEVSENIHRLLNLIIRDNHEKTVAVEKNRLLLTLMALFSEIDTDRSEEKLYGLLAEAIMFLFKGDTVSVFARDHDKFVTVISIGEAKKQVSSLSLRSDSVMISEVINNRRSVLCADAHELSRLGCPDNIMSLHLFPLSIQNETFGLLSVFNTQFTEEEIDTISRTCSFASFLLKTILSQKMLSSHINGLTAVNFALNLSTALKEPDALYRSIVEVSAKLVSAERASLMLPEETKRELLIKAVRGINSWIAKNIRVAVGTGIAGKVFIEGKPLIVADIEKSLSTRRKPSYRTGAFISIPLKIGDEAIGVLNLADRVDGEGFTEADMVFLHYFASYASVAIRGAQFYQTSEEMRTLSITDALTGLYNRRYFDERLFEELQRAIRYDSQFSLAILDIDDFKIFNDTEGHLAGDEILKIIADISRDSLRSIDIIARFGGEEFSLIMPQTDREEAYLVAERVRKNIKELTPKTWKNFPQERITVSVGVATFPADGKDLKTLIRNVDKSLYRAKMQGKDRTVIWDEIDPKIIRETTL